MSEVIKYWGTAGTGKTTRLLKDLEGLRDKYDLENDVCFCTYAVPMANDFLKSFYEKLLGEEYPGYRKCIKRFPYYATIHGVCKRLLCVENVIGTKDEEDGEEENKGKPNHQRIFCEQQKIDYDGGKNSECTGDLFFMTKTWLTNTMKNNRECTSFPNENKMDRELYERLLKDYNTFKKELGDFIDFDDMLVQVLDKGVYPHVKVLIVDEFQDMSPLQYAIYCMWRDKMELTIIAGDPNQSIYDFQGASPEFFIREEARQEVLPKTYRLGLRSWSYARALLKMYSLPIPNVTADQREDKIINIRKEDVKRFIRPMTKIFILTHTNRMAKDFAELLTSEGIPFMGGQVGGWGGSMLSIFNCVCLLTRGDQNAHVSNNDYRKFLMSMKKEYLAHGLSKNSKKEGAINIKDMELPRRVNLITLEKYINPILLDYIRTLPFDFGCLNGKWSIGRKMRDGSVDMRFSKAEKLNRVLVNPKFSYIGQPGCIYVGTIHSSKGREKEDVFLYDQISYAAFKDFIDNDASKLARLFFVGVTRHRGNLYIVQDNGWGVNTFELPNETNMCI